MKNQVQAWMDQLLSPAKGRERKKAWIYTVVNPILKGLDIEQHFLENKNWSFNPDKDELLSIRSAKSYVELFHHPNYVDFLQSNRSIRLQFEKRDEAVTILADACSLAFDVLMSKVTLRDALRQIARQEITHLSSDDVVEAFLPPIVQCLINGNDKLPSDWFLVRLWRNHRETLFSLGEPETLAIDDAGIILQYENESLMKELRDFRRWMGDQYDIPWVPYERC